MKWNRHSLAVLALALMVPVSANALNLVIDSVTSSDGDPTIVDWREVITIDLRLENPTNQEVFGLGLGVYGQDEGLQGSTEGDRILFLGGASAARVLNPVPGFGGVDNTLGAPEQRGGPTGPLQPPTPLTIQLFDGITTVAGANGDGSNDVGVDGAFVGDGDVHFRVQFRGRGLADGFQTVTLEFGTNASNGAIGPGGGELPFTNTQLSFVVTPEPGTALLMGLGLAALAGQGRKRRS